MKLGNVFRQFYDMADMVIVGRYVGAGALAAVGSAGTLMFLLTSFYGIFPGVFPGDNSRIYNPYIPAVRRRDKRGVRSVANGILS